MQFITTDQRIAVEAFSVGNIYQVIFTDNSYFLGACVGIGDNFVMFQRPEPELLFTLTIQSAADVSAINDDIVISRTYSGAPPLSFLSNGQPLLSWQINGNSEGVGDKTSNLFNPNSQITIDGNIYIGSIYPAGQYRVNNISNAPCYYKIGESGATGTINPSTNVYLNANDVVYIYCSRLSSNAKIGVTQGSAIVDYEPYGYKIPISCGGETNTIYLDAPLYDGYSISMAGTGIEIPTTNGQNTIAVDTTVQPSSIIIAAQL